MKKILKGLFILLFIILLSACTKDYKEISYTKFIDTFQEEGYLVNDSYKDDRYARYIEASGKSSQFIFYEFESEEEARKYVKEDYSNKKYYTYKDKKDYITVKCKKDRYFYLVQIGKTVIVGNTKSNKKEINRMMKKLGY